MLPPHKLNRHSQNVAEASRLYQIGVAALERGDREMARAALLQSLQAAVPTLETMVAVADELAEAGFDEDSAHVLRGAIEQFPGRVEPKRFLVQLLLDGGNNEQAIETAERALRDHPANRHLHLLSATAHESSGSAESAAAHLSAVLATDGHDLEANRKLVSVLRVLGDAAGALACLRRIVTATGRRDLEALTALGIALSGDGQHAEAIHMLAEVAKKQPDVASVRADLAMALLAAGRVSDAAIGFGEALKLDARSAQAHCGLGLAYQSLERWEEAADAFRTAEQLAPDTTAAPFNLGLVLIALGQLDEARQALQRAATIDPADPEIREAFESLAPAPEPDPAAQAASDPQQEVIRFGGDLKTFPLPDVLEFLRLQKKTGALVVSSRRGAGIVRLVHGRVTSASAPGVKRLGESLVEMGIVSRPDLEVALVAQRTRPDGSEALGERLVRQRPSDRERIGRVVFDQVLAALAEMLGWNEGAFSLHPGGGPELPTISFDVQQVLMELMGSDR